MELILLIMIRLEDLVMGKSLRILSVSVNVLIETYS